MDRVNLRVAWLYVKSWNNFGQHVIDETGLWNFGGEDLEAALMATVSARFNWRVTENRTQSQF